MSDVGELNVKLSLDDSEFTSGLADAKGEAEDAGSQIEEAFSKVGESILKGLEVAAVVDGIKEIGAAAADQQSAMVDVGEKMDLTGAQTDDLKQKFRALSDQFGTSMDTISESSAVLAQSGLYKDTTQLTDATDQLVKINKAWGGDMKSQADTLSQVARGYGLNTDQLGQWASMVTELSKTTGISTDQFAQGTKTFIPLQKELGLSLNQIDSFIGAFGKLGIAPEMAASSIKTMFQKFTSGSKQTTEAMAKLGVSQAQFDAAVKSGHLPDLFGQVASSLGKVSSEMDRANLAGDLFGRMGRQMAPNLPLLISDYQQLGTVAADAWTNNNALMDATNRRMETFWTQLDRTKNILGNFAAEIGDQFMQPVQDGLFQLNQFMEKAFGGDLTGAIDGVIGAISSYDWGGMFNGLIQAAENVGQAIMKVDWMGYLQKGWDKLSEFGSYLYDKLSSMVNSGEIYSIFYNLGTSIGTWLENAIEFVAPRVQGALQHIWDHLGEYASTAVNAAYQALTGLASGMLTALGPSITTLENWFGRAWNSIILDVAKVIEAITGGWSGVAGSVSSALGGIPGIVSGIFANIKGIVLGVVGDITGAIGGITSAISGIGGSVSSLLGGGGATASGTTAYRGGDTGSIVYRNSAGQMTDSNGNVLTGTAADKAFKDMAHGSGQPIGTSSVLSNLGTAVGGTIGAIGNKAGSVASSVYNYANNASGGILGLLGGKITSAVSNAVSYVSSKVPNYEMTGWAMPGTLAMSEMAPYGGSQYSNMINNPKYGLTPFTLSNTQQPLTEFEAQFMQAHGVDTQIAGTMPGAIPGAGTLSNPVVTKDVGISQMMGIPSFYQWNPGAATGAGTGTASAGVGPDMSAVDKAYQQAEATETAKQNLNNFSSALVKASAEGSDFCEAISEFGYMQEHSPELFQQSYIGATSGYTGTPGYSTASLGTVANATASTSSPVTKAQIVVANKVGTVQIGASTKAANSFVSGVKPATTFMAGAGVTVGNSIVTSSTTAANITSAAAEAAKIKGQQVNDDMEKTAYSCFDMWGEGVNTSSTELKGSAAAAAAGFGTSGATFSDYVKGASGSIGDVGHTFKADVTDATTNLSSALATQATSITKATTDMTSALAFYGSWGAGGSAAAGGSAGGSFPYGQTYAQTVGGAGSQWGGHSINGGGSWVGSGASQSGWGAQASAAAMGSSGGSYFGVQWFADGGVVSRPQIVGVGEAGPEAIIPLAQLQATMGGLANLTSGGQMIHTVINIDGKKIADSVGPAVVQRLRQGAGLKVR